MDIVGWWADLGGTLIGTGVGFALAMIWDRKRDRDQEARDRETSMRSILLNLEDIAERLQLPTFEDAGDTVVASFDLGHPKLPLLNSCKVGIGAVGLKDCAHSLLPGTRTSASHNIRCDVLRRTPCTGRTCQRLKGHARGSARGRHTVFAR